MENVHQPVLLDEIITYLQPQPNRQFVDGTLGGGGHTLAILNKTAPHGRVLAIDLDETAIADVAQRAGRDGARLILVQDNFKNLKQIIRNKNFTEIHGILLDLGLSSNQLEDPSRGFSFNSTESLHMSFSHDEADRTEEIISSYSTDALAALFREYGEERLAKPIAKAIVARRTVEPIHTAEQLREIVAGVYQRFFHGRSKMNPATKVFQALRIEVNDELRNLERVLPDAIAALVSGGRLAVISYHSLEDRMVKNYFRREATDCICPPEMPVCQCGHRASIKIITKKPVTPSDEELKRNPRSRSAKLRVVEKI